MPIYIPWLDTYIPCICIESWNIYIYIYMYIHIYIYIYTYIYIYRGTPSHSSYWATPMLGNLTYGGSHKWGFCQNCCKKIHGKSHLETKIPTDFPRKLWNAGRGLACILSLAACRGRWTCSWPRRPTLDLWQFPLTSGRGFDFWDFWDLFISKYTYMYIYIHM